MRRVSYLLVGMCAIMSAQEIVRIAPRPSRNGTHIPVQTSANLRVDSNLVLVPVVVTNRREELVTGLQKEDFTLYEDGVPQNIKHLVAEDAPVSILLQFDSSGSMADMLERSRMAVSAFLKASNPEDEFALIEFNHRATVLVPFTNDAGEIANRLPFFYGRGSTALIDAVHLGLMELKHARHARKAIFIENHSRYSQEIRREVREADVQIYEIGIIRPIADISLPPEEVNGGSLLSAIANLTGGRLFRVFTASALPDVANKIGTALRSQYLLAYSPTNPKRDGKYHRIQVKLVQPEGSPKNRTSFRSGYLAREE